VLKTNSWATSMDLTGISGFIGKFSGFDSHTGRSRRMAIDRLDMLATLFDTAILIPGTNIRFGLEALLRMWPGIGDAAASTLSLYLLYSAAELGVPRRLIARMLINVVIEGTLGAIPIAGDAFDVFFRANRRNVALVRAHFAGTGDL
jgi:Domain of unknown function (DUF4112)